MRVSTSESVEAAVALALLEERDDVVGELARDGFGALDVRRLEVTHPGRSVPGARIEETRARFAGFQEPGTTATSVNLGYALSSEEHRPLDLVAPRPAGGGGGISVRARLRPLPPLDRPAGSEPVRVERDRRHRARRRRRCGSAPASPARRSESIPAIIAQAAATAAAMMPGRFFLGVGTGREPERAHPRRPLAVSRRAARDARGSGCRDARALEGRADEPRGSTTTRSRTRGSTRCRKSRPPIVVAAGATGAPSSPDGSATG